MKKALILGITGQDGSYLAELLLTKGYEVHGVVRRSSSLNTWRLDDLYNDPAIHDVRFFLHYGDITDSISLMRILKTVAPDEVYNLSAQSHVKISFEIPEITAQIDALGTLKLLESIRLLDLKDSTRIYQASTSELYGKVIESPQNENTPFYPRSPYGVAKMYGFWILKNYREAYGMHASNGILFNHESERRGFNFVTRKITIGLSKIQAGKQDVLLLGNLDAKRDWGYAPEYVEAMWRMLQQDTPDDYVIASGTTHSVREFVEVAARELGMDIMWQGEGVDEVGIDTKTGQTIIAINEKYFRPTEVDMLCGDPKKAKEVLGWEAQVSFEDLVKKMVRHDHDLITNGKLILY